MIRVAYANNNVHKTPHVSITELSTIPSNCDSNTYETIPTITPFVTAYTGDNIPANNGLNPITNAIPHGTIQPNFSAPPIHAGGDSLPIRCQVTIAEITNSAVRKNVFATVPPNVITPAERSSSARLKTRSFNVGFEVRNMVVKNFRPT